MPDDHMKWRLPERWTVIQSDDCQISIEVSQDGNTLVGTARDGPDNRSPKMIGTISGSVVGDAISFVIYWPDKSIAEFSGTVSGDGRANGTTVGRSDDVPVQEWHAEPALSAWE